VLAILVELAVVVLLNSARFHRYLLQTAERQASTALGVRVEARDYTLHWSGISPAVDLYNVVVSGAAPYSTPPLLEADHIRLAVGVVSVLRSKWYLGEVRIDRPVAHVIVDARSRDNLPRSSSQGHTDVFELGVRHVLIDRGEVYYNNRKTPLDADLHQLTFQSAFNASTRSYSGTLNYRDGHLQFGAYNPMPHDLVAQFEASPATFNVSHATLTSGNSQLTLRATLENYNQPRVEASYMAVLDAGSLRRVLNEPSVPAGLVQFVGSVYYQSEPGRRLLDTVTLAGNLSSNALDIDTPSLRTRISNLAGRYALSGGNFSVQELRARLLGGELTANMTMRNISGATTSHLQTRVRGLSLANLETLAKSPSLDQVSLRGVLNADADAAWGQTLADLAVHSDANIQGSAASRTGGAQVLPLNGVIHAGYRAASQEITFANSYLRTPRTSLTLQGTVSRHSSLAVQMQTADLHELETVADLFRSSQPVPSLGLQGTASFIGSVRGSTSSPQITGQLNATNLQVRGTSWRAVSANVALDSSHAGIRNGDLEAAPRGRITFGISAGLNRWSLSGSSPLQATLNASQLDVGSLSRLAGCATPIAGILSARISVSGSELNPSGQGTLTLTQAKVAQEPIQSASLSFQSQGEKLTGSLMVRAPAGPAQAEFSYIPRQQAYRVQLDARAVRLDRLQTLQLRNIDIGGVLNLQASGQGTLQNPQFKAAATSPQLKIRDQTITGFKVQADIVNHVASVDLDSQVLNASVRAHGTVNLNGDYYTQATLDTNAIPVQTILAAYAPAQPSNITGQTELHATLRGPLKNKMKVEAHATIPSLQVKYNNAVQIGATGPIHIDYVNGVLAVQQATLRGTDTDLTLAGSLPINSPQPISLLLQGNVDLHLAQLIDSDISSSGQLHFNVNSSGGRANPNVQGQVQIINANLANLDWPVGLQNGNGVLTLTRDRLEVTDFQGIMGGGTVTASGSVLYRPSLGLNLTVTAKDTRLLYPEGMRESVSAHVTLTGSPTAARLGGQIRLDNLSFTPAFDLNTFMNQLGGSTVPTPTTGFSQNLQLDVALKSSSDISLSSRTLSLDGTANLRITGTAAQPVILGRVNLTGGDVIFNGHRYTIESGTLEFANPSETQANVNITANTTIQQYNIRLQFQGPTDHLHTVYSSDPSLPPSDIINLLAFGKTTEASAVNPAPGNLGAEAAVASQVGSQITSRVEQAAGISQLSVDPLLGCNQQTPGSCITVQQRVSGQVFVTFQTDLNDIQQETVEVQYQATPRVTVSGTRDQNGGFGFDTRIKKTW